MDKGPRIDLVLVEEFVEQAHTNLDRVEELLCEQPALINAVWDWGGGDWETALGGASHMGRRDIALHLLERGARIDVFAAAMLGYLDFVQAAVASQPMIVDVLGPHGIPLIAHAQRGGPEANGVLEFLSSVAG